MKVSRNSTSATQVEQLRTFGVILKTLLAVVAPVVLSLSLLDTHTHADVFLFRVLLL